MQNRNILIAAATIALTLAACSFDSTSETDGSSPSTTPSTTVAAVSPTTTDSSVEATDTTGSGTPISIIAGDRTFTATLNDSDAAADFAATLPLTVPATRVGSIEFMAELGAPLTETGPFYRTVEAGDIVYWNPRDSVTVIYAPTSPVSELTKLGEVTSDLREFEALPDDVEMRFELDPELTLDIQHPNEREGHIMNTPQGTDKKVWFITGAGRGMGVDIARAALAAGHAVVAAGRTPDKVTAAIGAHPDLLAVTLDITNPADSDTAAQAALDRFGHIDVLVNNAGNFYAGFFEELTAEDFRAQLDTNLFGPLNVTRAVLPIMRAQRAGLVVTMSSTAGIVGQEFTSAYAASKFALEGWLESLTPEVVPFGIRTMLVEPGFFRTDLLEDTSTTWPAPSIDDYAERTRQTIAGWQSMNGRQGGDPAKLAAGLIELADLDTPPLRWIAGADAIGAVEQKARELLAQADAHRELSTSLAHDDTLAGQP